MKIFGDALQPIQLGSADGCAADQAQHIPGTGGGNPTDQDSFAIGKLLGQLPAVPLAKPVILSAVAFDAPCIETKVEVTHQSKTSVSSAEKQYVVARRVDPLYLEIANVPFGGGVELVNLSANPGADFDAAPIRLKPAGYAEKGEKIYDVQRGKSMDDPKMPITNRLGKRGVAGFLLGPESIAKFDLGTHGKLWLRTFDANGQRSEAVPLSISGDPKELPLATAIPEILSTDVKYSSETTAKTLTEFDRKVRDDLSTLVTQKDTTTTTTNYTTTKTTRQLGGPAWRASFLIAGNWAYPLVGSETRDNQKPKVLEGSVKLAVKDGALVVRFNKAIEPEATVRIRNPRTGEMTEGEMPWSQKLDLALPAGTATGDVLKVVALDSNNSVVRYAVVDPKAPGGLRFDDSLGTLEDPKVPAEVKPAVLIS
ncbi:MAG: hypothetical protein U1E65_12330 [Myxococcota bacterium]